MCVSMETCLLKLTLAQSVVRDKDGVIYWHHVLCSWSQSLLTASPDHQYYMRVHIGTWLSQTSNSLLSGFLHDIWLFLWSKWIKWMCLLDWRNLSLYHSDYALTTASSCGFLDWNHQYLSLITAPSCGFLHSLPSIPLLSHSSISRVPPFHTINISPWSHLNLVDSSIPSISLLDHSSILWVLPFHIINISHWPHLHLVGSSILYKSLHD